LTGTFAARQLLPFVPMHQRLMVLRTDAAVSLTYYISRGRPLLQPSKLPATDDTWDTMSEKTWANEDLHVPKVIRALKVVVQNAEMDPELGRKTAGMVVKEMVEKKRRWSYLGHGFDEAWEEVAKEKK
jgi:Questin oxidase-like